MIFTILKDYSGTFNLVIEPLSAVPGHSKPRLSTFGYRQAVTDAFRPSV